MSWVSGGLKYSSVFTNVMYTYNKSGAFVLTLFPVMYFVSNGWWCWRYSLSIRCLRWSSWRSAALQSSSRHGFFFMSSFWSTQCVVGTPIALPYAIESCLSYLRHSVVILCKWTCAFRTQTIYHRLASKHQFWYHRVLYPAIFGWQKRYLQ